MRFDEIPQNLVDHARHGDGDALERLCLAVQPGVYALMLSLLKNTEDASDALQEVLIKMIRFIGSLRDSHAFAPWLLRLAVNHASSSRRPGSVAIIANTDAIDDPDLQTVAGAAAPASPRCQAESNEMLGLIRTAVSALPERQRTAIILFELEDLTIREVADAMEITEGAVKFHLNAGRNGIRRQLESAGIAGPSLFEGSLK